jgi:hypothetical protein
LPEDCRGFLLFLQRNAGIFKEGLVPSFHVLSFALSITIVSRDETAVVSDSDIAIKEIINKRVNDWTND